MSRCGLISTRTMPSLAAMRSISGGSHARRSGTWRIGANDVAAYSAIAAVAAIASRRVPDRCMTIPASAGGRGGEGQVVRAAIEDPPRSGGVEPQQSLREDGEAGVVAPPSPGADP